MSWSASPQLSDYNQIVNVETYQRLVKQEMNELHTLATSGTQANKDHFQPYYTNFGANELSIHRALVRIVDMLKADYGLTIPAPQDPV